MACVAVTRGGFGDVWVFPTRTEAFLHPLVQYGDALLLDPSSLTDQYNRLEWRSLRLLAKLPPGELPENRRHSRGMMETQAPQIFEALVRLAQPAPSDPAEVCRLVTQDRRLGTMAKKKQDAPADAASSPTEGATAASNLPAQVKGPKGVPADAVITMGKDKEGKDYGPDNNPKKAGSKTHGRFQSYQTGMTIQQALDAGLTTADLNYDKEHGFISWTGGSQQPASAAAENPGDGEGETAEDQQDAA